jgi:hypothetical protein
MRRGLGKAAITVALLLQLETPDEAPIGRLHVANGAKHARTVEFCNRLYRAAESGARLITADTAACRSAAAKA